MKAIRIHYTDTASELHVDEVPKPEVAADQVLIRTQAIGMNRADPGCAVWRSRASRSCPRR